MRYSYKVSGKGQGATGHHRIERTKVEPGKQVLNQAGAGGGTSVKRFLTSHNAIRYSVAHALQRIIVSTNHSSKEEDRRIRLPDRFEVGCGTKGYSGAVGRMRRSKGNTKFRGRRRRRRESLKWRVRSQRRTTW